MGIYRIGILVLAAVVFSAVWCVDGCMDPNTKGPLPSSGTYTCTICVMPFATVPFFSLPEQGLKVRMVAEATSIPAEASQKSNHL